MSTCPTTFLLLLHLLAIVNIVACNEDLGVAQMARAGFLRAMDWAHQSSLRVNGVVRDSGSGGGGLAWRDCVKLYEEADAKLARLTGGGDGGGYSGDDAVAWLSGAAASHRSCLDGLEEKGVVVEGGDLMVQNLTVVLREALALYGNKMRGKGGKTRGKGARKRLSFDQNTGLLTSWNAATSKADC